ncbi:hypothetical protein E1B28_008537 [Marasmius oreades]|uniref:Uncharacterized protein n=1 Tax=Marasmius oreades TaxID=181124 RepID=A0A9P7RZ68_9AGAR|nr:uncharacterized protein E1B28_008537 [Marasmius oreades]KAG7092168.1 hypothetical protein E1B28_008537 [Marasmius oreades]
MTRAIDLFLPWIVFPPLTAAAFYCIVVYTRLNGLGDALNAQCPVELHGNSTPFRLTYTGIERLDGLFCILVSTFHAAFEPKARLFLSYFMSQATPIFMFISLESARKGIHFTLRYPVIFTFLMQVATFGATFACYWLPFITTGAAKAAGSMDSIITQADAEAVIFGNILGVGLPTIAMVLLLNPYVTALWQFIPVYGSLATLLHLSFRSPKYHPQSGYKTIRANYRFLFILDATMHMILVVSKFRTPEALKAFLLPSLSLNTSNATSERLVLNLLQFDFVFGMGASLLATLWFARTPRQLGLLLLWNVFGTIVVGPGAAMAAVVLWREAKLHPNDSTAVEKERKY